MQASKYVHLLQPSSAASISGLVLGVRARVKYQPLSESILVKFFLK
jgi:hypothetical protein